MRATQNGIATGHEVADGAIWMETIMDLNKELGRSLGSRIPLFPPESIDNNGCGAAVIGAITAGTATYLDSHYGDHDTLDDALLQRTNH